MPSASAASMPVSCSNARSTNTQRSASLISKMPIGLSATSARQRASASVGPPSGSSSSSGVDSAPGGANDAGHPGHLTFIGRPDRPKGGRRTGGPPAEGLTPQGAGGKANRVRATTTSIRLPVGPAFGGRHRPRCDRVDDHRAGPDRPVRRGHRRPPVDPRRRRGREERAVRHDDRTRLPHDGAVRAAPRRAVQRRRDLHGHQLRRRQGAVHHAVPSGGACAGKGESFNTTEIPGGVQASCASPSSSKAQPSPPPWSTPSPRYLA